jgi:hypothetical protein
MNDAFQVVSVPYERFAPLFDLNDDALETLGVRRMTVDAKPGFPCRASLVDAEPGETVLLVPYVHHESRSPYRASGPIFIRKDAVTAQPAPGEVPAMLRHRLLSIRAYDGDATMIDADVAPGMELERVIGRLFGNDRVRYLHVHNAGPGCFNCSVVRA